MDHIQAAKIQASAHHVLGDLSPSEAEAVEEHFFSCQPSEAEAFEEHSLNDSAPLPNARIMRLIRRELPLWLASEWDAEKPCNPPQSEYNAQPADATRQPRVSQVNSPQAAHAKAPLIQTWPTRFCTTLILLRTYKRIINSLPHHA